MNHQYVLLSRTKDAPFVRVPALDLGDSDLGWRVGPIAFQGTSWDVPLFCARREIFRISPPEVKGDKRVVLS